MESDRGCKKSKNGHNFKLRYDMNHERNYRFHTRVIHAAQSSENWQGATLPPIFQTASHLHPTAENLSQTFAGH
jgi:hypothetical protein